MDEGAEFLPEGIGRGRNELREVEHRQILQRIDPEDGARHPAPAEIAGTARHARPRGVEHGPHAKAEADAIKLKGDAEASAIQAKANALRENPSLVALAATEKWDGKLPSTFVPGSAVPFLQIPRGQ